MSVIEIELANHVNNILDLIANGKEKIVIFAAPGDGKSSLIALLKEQLASSDINWYIEEGENLMSVPYITAVSFVEDIADQFTNKAAIYFNEGTTEYEDMKDLDFEPDAVYVLRYSREYKEAVTGITFVGDDRPFHEYTTEQRRQKWLRIQEDPTTTFDSISELEEWHTNV